MNSVSPSRLRLLSLSLVLAFTSAGCSGKVIVTDLAGRPIEGATVVPVSLSINGAPVLTNAKGEANVPNNVSLQRTVWVNISKEGYSDIQVERPPTCPLNVALHPKPVAPHNVSLKEPLP